MAEAGLREPVHAAERRRLVRARDAAETQCRPNAAVVDDDDERGADEPEPPAPRRRKRRARELERQQDQRERLERGGEGPCAPPPRLPASRPRTRAARSSRRRCGRRPRNALRSAGSSRAAQPLRGSACAARDERAAASTPSMRAVDSRARRGARRCRRERRNRRDAFPDGAVRRRQRPPLLRDVGQSRVVREVGRVAAVRVRVVDRDHARLAPVEIDVLREQERRGEGERLSDCRDRHDSPQGDSRAGSACCPKAVEPSAERQEPRPTLCSTRRRE